MISRVVFFLGGGKGKGFPLVAACTVVAVGMAAVCGGCVAIGRWVERQATGKKQPPKQEPGKE